MGRGGEVSLVRTLRVGLLAILAAAVANALVATLAVALLSIWSGFLALQAGPVVSFTVVGVVGAVIESSLVTWFARRPARLFRRIALAVLLVSLVLDLVLLVASPFPGTTLAAVAALMVMHVVAWAISVGMLTTLVVSRGGRAMTGATVRRLGELSPRLIWMHDNASRADERVARIADGYNPGTWTCAVQKRELGSSRKAG